MAKKIVLVSLVFLFLSSFVLFASAEKNAPGEGAFLGAFTTDTYPVSGYEVVGAGDTISTAQIMFQAQGGDLNAEKGNYLGALTETMLNGIRQSLIEQAKKAGYDAIIGYRVTVAQTFDGFGSSIINGNYGVGYAAVMAQGVPVKIKKKSWLW